MSDHLGQDSMLAELQDACPIAGDAEVYDKLTESIRETERAADVAVRSADPYLELQAEFQKAADSFARGECSLSFIEQDLAAYRTLAETEHLDHQEAYWQKRLQQLRALESEEELQRTEEQKAARLLLQEQWGKMIDELSARWRMNFINEMRKKMMAKLTDWLNHMQELSEALDDFGFEPGLLFNLARDNLTLADLATMKRWAKYLAEDKEARRLCELLGKMNRADHTKRLEWIDAMETFIDTRQSVDSRDEFSGVRLGNSVEQALPQEKALLANEDTALLFDLKFAESRLMQFDTLGWVNHEAGQGARVQIETSEDEKKGPLIICVDSSGSMRGMPETIAKAVALYLATSARQQSRQCFLITFSTGVQTLDLSQRGGMRELVFFLQHSFGGGTDLTPALSNALETMNTEAYQNADVLVVSDMVMGYLPDNLTALIDAAKANDNRFYSLVVGDMTGHGLKDIFDAQWHYQPGGGVRKLVDIAAAAGGKFYA